MYVLAAALLAASPATIESKVAAARPGDTIKLAVGNYEVLRIKQRNWTPAVSIEATGATILGATIEKSTGVTWRGGTFVGELVDGFGIGRSFNVLKSSNVVLDGAVLKNARNGVVIEQSNNIRILNNTITAMSADGIDVALSNHIVIDGNSCAEFAKSPGAHPDCIQLWSRAVSAPTSDVIVTNNRVHGDMQGIFLGDGHHDGLSDGGFDRVVIRGNIVMNTQGGGIGVINCRECIVRDNIVSSLPGYVHKAQLYTRGGSVLACGNKVPMVPRQATPPCPSNPAKKTTEDAQEVGLNR